MRQKNALILGAGPTFGMSLARSFQDADYSTTVVGRSAARLHRYAREADLRSDRAELIEQDLTDTDGLLALLRSRADPERLPDVLVSNAALIRVDSAVELAPQELEWTLRVNLLAAHASIFALQPPMAARGHGSIMLVGGFFAYQPEPTRASLSIAKGALQNLAHVAFPEGRRQHVQIATLTIDGFLERGTDLDPDTVAKVLVSATERPEAEWKPELVFPGDGEGRDVERERNAHK